jgi:hypothetical protein
MRELENDFRRSGGGGGDVSDRVGCRVWGVGRRVLGVGCRV